MQSERGSRARALLHAVLTAVLLSVAIVVTPAARASAPPPPLDACLARGEFNIADPACLENHLPSWGDWFGPIGSVIRHVAQRGDTLGLSFDPGADVFFDRPISCGIGGCIGHSIPWRQEEGQLRGFWMETVGGCTASSVDCSIRVWPDYDMGDLAERWWVLYVQHYRGIFPQRGVAHAIYVAPRYYPVRVDPVDSAGRVVVPRPGTLAYAVRTGRSPVAGACASGSWWQANRRVVNPPVPDCVVLERSADDLGRAGYAGVLPVDSGTWSIVAAPAGDAGAPLASRPTPYRATSVQPLGDDLRIPIVRERRPVPQVTVVPETETLPVGGAQDIGVTVAAVDGEVGSLTVAFDDPSVLAVSPLDPPTLGLADADPVALAPTEPFTLAQGQERTFTVRVSGLGEGDAELLARVSGTDDVGDPVAGDGIASVAVVAPGAAEGLEPPVVDVAVTGAAGGHVEGTATGAPGGTLTVTVWTARANPDRTCAQRQSGPDTAVVGSADVTLGDDGTGAFAFDAPLTEGWFTFGVSAIGAQVSRIGDCRQVVGDTPLISVADAQVAEGTATEGTTALVFTIALSQASDLPVTVHLSTTDGTATSPADHVNVVDRELSFAPGETTAQVTLDVVPDAEPEEDETILVTLSDPVDGRLPAPDALGPTAEATGTIVDDDAAAVTDTPDVRGTWRWVYRVRFGGRTLTAPYTVTITEQDPATGRVSGRILVQSYDPYPDYRGRVSGTVEGDRIRWRTSGDNVDGLIEGRLVRRGGDLAIREDDDGKVTYVLVKPKGG